MLWIIDQWGNEVNVDGYLRSAVEGWDRHGIYPPPMVGDWNNPRVVTQVKAHREQIARLAPEAQERHFQSERQFMREFMAFAATAPTEASKSY